MGRGEGAWKFLGGGIAVDVSTAGDGTDVGIFCSFLAGSIFGWLDNIRSLFYPRPFARLMIQAWARDGKQMVIKAKAAAKKSAMLPVGLT
jgi:hypothetical protein